MSNNLSSQRQLRFSELIRSLISECLLVEDFYNFSFEVSSITISYVKMSKDLRIANVYLMPLGGEHKNKIIDTSGKELMLTVPIKNGNKKQLLKDVLISKESNFIDKYLKSIFFNYKKKKYFDEIFPKIKNFEV